MIDTRWHVGTKEPTVQENHPSGLMFFRGSEPAGFRFHNRSAVARSVTMLPEMTDPDLADATWFGASDGAWDAFIDLHHGQPADPSTQLRVLFNKRGLFVAARCVEPTPTAIRSLVSADSPDGRVNVEGKQLPYSAIKDDHFVLFLDPTHEAQTYYRFLVTAGGYSQARCLRCSYAEQIHPVCHENEVVDVVWHRRAVMCDDAWYAFISVPWQSVGLAGPPRPTIIGFNALRHRSHPEGTFSAWARVSSPQTPVATDFGDVSIGDVSLFVPVVDFGEPTFDWNRLGLRLQNMGQVQHVHASLRVESTDGGGVISDRMVEVTLPPSAASSPRTQIEIPYFLDWHERLPHRMTLTLADANDGRMLFETCYRLGRAADVCVTDRYIFDRPPTNPEPEDESFVTLKRQWLNWKIGRFLRRTTVHGAPSDFCIEHIDGRVRFNLMKPGVCRDIARYVEELFNNDLDRLCAVTLLMHQKAFTMHCAPLVSMHADVSAASAMRLNGGHCYSRAVALAGVMRHLQRAGSDELFDAAIVYVLGHVIVVVRETDGRRYLFDPTFGSYFYHHDNRRLATEQELAEDPSLHERCIRNRRCDYCNPHTHADGRIGHIIWPAGAPIDF